ncbi:MAG: hypothetical protein OHK0039_26090 [Bacteroidia bacterium]
MLHIGIGLLAAGCKLQDLPPVSEGEPVFFAEGTWDSTPRRIEAGREGYYMDTDYGYDDQMLVLAGGLQPAGCTACTSTLHLNIRNYRTALPGQEIDLDSALRAGSYPWYRQGGAPGSEVFRVSFYNESPSGSTQQYSWDFGDGTHATGPNPTHDYTDSSLLAAMVCLDALDGTGCTTTICNEVALNEAPCAVDFVHVRYPGNSYVEFRSTVTGQPPYTFEWSFGDGTTATLGNPGYYYSAPGLYTACLTVRDAQGCVASLCKNIAADPAYCEHNFSYEVLRTSIPDTLQRSAVTLRWTDADGRQYSSAAGDQGAASYFELLGREAYEPDADGRQTQLLRLRFACTLYEIGGTGRIDLREVDAVMAVAHPDRY